MTRRVKVFGCSRARASVVLLTGFAMLAPNGARTRGADAYERPPVVRPDSALPPELARGEHHQVESVAINGFLIHSKLRSDFGPLETNGEAELRIRVQEFTALARLAEVSETEVFAKAAGRAAVKPVTATANVVQHPVDTVKGVPDGLGRLFGKAKRAGSQLKRAVSSDDEGEDEGPSAAETSKQLAKSFLGVGAAHRRWARELGIDPFTTNPLLRQRLDHVTRVDAAGGLTRFLVPLPSTAALRLADNVNDLVWSYDSQELLQHNQKVIASWKVNPALAEAFLANGAYTPTRHTRVIAALDHLSLGGGRAAFLEAAAQAESEAQALFYQQSAEYLDWYDREVARLARLQPDGRLVVAVTIKGRRVSVVPVDQLYWSEELATKVHRSRSLQEDDKRELWTTADVSERARRELAKLGWTLHALPPPPAGAVEPKPDKPR